MSEIGKFMRSVEGTDETGMGKSACCVTIQRSDTGRQEAETIDSACTLRAVLAMHLTDSWAVIDLEFEDGQDPDLVRMTEICSAFDERAFAENSLEERESLVLSVTQSGEYESFLVGLDGTWGLKPAKSGGGCRGIRFIFNREKTGVYELDEEEMEGMIGEAVEEVEWQGQI